jgi:acetolactate decarboxylase
MLRRVRLLALAILLLCPALAAAGPKQPALAQIGVIDALLAGAYDGSFRLGELKRLGDLGLGTFDGLDGELVLLEGVVYQVPFDGAVRRPSDRVTTPFAQVTRFAAASRVPLPAGAALHDIEAALDRALGDTARFAAVRLDARFAALSARSVPRQSPPYRPLAEVAKGQAVFRFANAAGTLIGLRSPDFSRGLSVPGWHWHFLTSDRTRGGHVLDCALAGPASAGLMPLRRFELTLPETGIGGLDLARDRSSELKAVEQGPERAK